MASSESCCAPGVFLRDDPVCGAQLENQSELRAPTVRHAAYYLDAAIAARTVPGNLMSGLLVGCQFSFQSCHYSCYIIFSVDDELSVEDLLIKMTILHAFDYVSEADDDARNSHLLFTLNVYQYRVDHDNAGQNEGIKKQ